MYIFSIKNRSLCGRKTVCALSLLLTFALTSLFGALFGVPAIASDLHGFVEGAAGAKFGDERAEKNSYNLAEARLQLKYHYFPKLIEEYNGELSLKGELIYDGYKEEVSTGVRDLNLSINPVPSIDIKIGRQILTWGTGDLLFINDLFPKDYISFFTGRSTEYLKRPSNAIRLWYFRDSISFDLVTIPQFEPNKSISGRRLSFYDGLTGGITGFESTRRLIKPAKTVNNAEVSLRIYKTIKSYEAAIYLFKGFYKEPRQTLDTTNEIFTYPRLRVYGASLRGPVAGGIGNFEIGYYDSRDDTGGTDNLTENSSIKYLTGYTRDLGNDLKVGAQYMVEQMLDFRAYKENLQAGSPAQDELRHLFTLRLTRLLRAQTIDANLFIFYSPTDEDTYIRPSIGYKANDDIKITLGANIFSGKKDHTQFGSLEGNNNLYLRARYSF